MSLRSERKKDVMKNQQKALVERGKKSLIEICKIINQTGNCPDDFTKATIVTIEKKMNALECEDHRTISLIAHASKIK